MIAPAMAESEASALLREFVRERHVRFTIATEKIIRDDGPMPIGFDVRLLAWHGRERHGLEHCPVCAALADRLRDVAEFCTALEEKPGEIEIDPDYSGLYDSRDRPGTDEVALDLHLLLRGEDDHAVGPGEERFLKQVKARLKALGAREC